ncbi:MAG: cytochrome c [Candidatus Eremiobacteraeota bacterium]|nr:cytochrome c [Candidatus Eremiobacteraeota bacterium]
MMRGVILGVTATLVVIGLVLYIGVRAGMMPANADGKPSKLERWAAKTSLQATLAREAPTTAPPIALNDANLIAGIRLYAATCAVCHGASDGNPSRIARGLYQHPPQLAKDGVEDDPEGVTYWKVDHGIRFTGMPAFGKTLRDEQIWQLALFLKHMDGLPPAPQRVWKAVKSEAAGPPTADR